jgi:hypothetical protein
MLRFPKPDARVQLPVALDGLDVPALLNQGQHIGLGFWQIAVVLCATTRLTRHEEPADRHAQP